MQELRLFWIIVMLPIHREIITIIFSYPISWSITALMFIFYYLRESRKWPKV